MKSPARSPRWGVVVPSNRPDRLATFESAWTPIFERHEVGLFVVNDREPWPGIPEWIPKRTDAIRSWGIVQAVRAGCEYIASMDDDVLPIGSVDPFNHYEVAFEHGAPVSSWLSVGSLTDTGLQMRGFPHCDTPQRKIAVQYGGWNGVPDLDGVTQAECAIDDAEFSPVVLPVPVGTPVTTCAMNMAFPAWFAVAMWQLPVVDGRYDRWCDIWSGLVQKRVADACGFAMVLNGRARVFHSRASDTAVNIRKEAPGYRIHDGLWETIVAEAPVAGRYDIRDVERVWPRVIEALAFHVDAKGDREWADRILADSEKWAALFRS